MAIVSANALTRNSIQVGLNAALTETTADQWSVTTAGNGAVVDVVRAVVASSTTSVTLTVGAGMSAGETYTVVSTATGGSATCVCPNTAPELRNEWPHGFVESFTRAVAEEIQIVSGAPTTITVDDWKPGQVTVRVESTLGFPDAGTIFLDGYRIQYTSKGPMAFRGATSTMPPGLSFGERTTVVCDVTAIS